MADTVTATYLNKGNTSIAILLTGISDATNESNVIKIDKSTLATVLGVEPGKLIIESVKWTMKGYSYIKLAFNHTTPDTALVLCDGVGKLCFKDVGGLPDPMSAGGTGDLQLTSVGGTAGSAYTIFIKASIYG